MSGPIKLPSIPQATDQTLVVTLGQRSLGFTLLGYSLQRPGPAVSLATATEVRLVARRSTPSASSYAECVEPYGCDAACEEWESATGLVPLFDVEGTVTDAADGEATFTLTSTHLDASGRYLAEVRVTFASGAKWASRQMAVTLIESLAA